MEGYSLPLQATITPPTNLGGGTPYPSYVDLYSTEYREFPQTRMVAILGYRELPIPFDRYYSSNSIDSSSIISLYPCVNSA